MAYRFYNANSKGNFVNDCVVRAISTAERETWDETYNKLSDMAQAEGVLLDNVPFVERYLDKRYKRVAHCSNTVGELIEEYPQGTYLVTMEGHISVIIEGTLFDTFDCRRRRIWGVWRVKY